MKITLLGEQSYGAIRALEAAAGKLKWQFKLLAPAWVPVLSTGRTGIQRN